MISSLTKFISVFLCVLLPTKFIGDPGLRFQTECTVEVANSYIDNKVAELLNYNREQEKLFELKWSELSSYYRKESVNLSTYWLPDRFKFELFKSTSFVSRKNSKLIETGAIADSMDTTDISDGNCDKLDRIKKNLEEVFRLNEEVWQNSFKSLEDEYQKMVALATRKVDFSSSRPKYIVGRWVDVINKEQNIVFYVNGEVQDQDYRTGQLSNKRFWFVRNSDLCYSMFNDTTSRLCVPFRISNDTLYQKAFGEWMVLKKKR